MALVCPNCKTDLIPKMIGGIEIDFCENGCKGIWFDEGELKKIREVPDKCEIYKNVEGEFVSKEKTESLKEDARICPRCPGVELYKYNWDMKSNIFLDSCDNCNGIWIDAGELKGMNEYLKEMATKAVPDSEEMKIKMVEIEREAIMKLEQDKENNIQKVIDWDLWLFDDMLRFMVKKFTD